MAYKSEIKLSKLHNFILISSENGIINIFRIIYQNAIPKSLVHITSYITNEPSVSSINDYDLVAATIIKQTVIIWDIIRGFTLNGFELPEEVHGSIFNEKYGYLYIWSDNIIYIYSVNGTFISKYQVEGKIDEIIGSDDKFIIYKSNSELKYVSFDASRNIFMKISKIPLASSTSK